MEIMNREETKVMDRNRLNTVASLQCTIGVHYPEIRLNVICILNKAC